MSSSIRMAPFRSRSRMFDPGTVAPTGASVMVDGLPMPATSSAAQVEDWTTFRGDGKVIARSNVLSAQQETFSGGAVYTVIRLLQGGKVTIGHSADRAFWAWWNADRPAVGRGGRISGGALLGLGLLAGLASAFLPEPILAGLASEFLPEPKPDRLLSGTPRWHLLRQDLAQLEAAIAQYGSQTALARAVGVRPETVCNNLKRLRSK